MKLFNNSGLGGFIWNVATGFLNKIRAVYQFQKGLYVQDDNPEHGVTRPVFGSDPTQAAHPNFHQSPGNTCEETTDQDFDKDGNMIGQMMAHGVREQFGLMNWAVKDSDNIKKNNAVNQDFLVLREPKGATLNISDNAGAGVRNFLVVTMPSDAFAASGAGGAYFRIDLSFRNQGNHGKIHIVGFGNGSTLRLDQYAYSEGFKNSQAEAPSAPSSTQPIPVRIISYGTGAGGTGHNIAIEFDDLGFLPASLDSYISSIAVSVERFQVQWGGNYDDAKYLWSKGWSMEGLGSLTTSGSVTTRDISRTVLNENDGQVIIGSSDTNSFVEFNTNDITKPLEEAQGQGNDELTDNWVRRNSDGSLLAKLKNDGVSQWNAEQDYFYEPNITNKFGSRNLSATTPYKRENAGLLRERDLTGTINKIQIEFDQQNAFTAQFSTEIKGEFLNASTSLDGINIDLNSTVTFTTGGVSNEDHNHKNTITPQWYISASGNLTLEIQVNNSLPIGTAVDVFVLVESVYAGSRNPDAPKVINMEFNNTRL